MPGYTSELYNYISSIDKTFKNDVSFDQFKSKMADRNYSKTMYDWIGQNDNTFQSDVPFDLFREKLGYKKKSSTGLPSQPQGKGTTSATVKTTTLKPSVSSVGKKTDYEIQMFTGFPGKEGKQYALDKSSAVPVWREKSNAGYDKAITDPARVDALNKHFKQKASSSEMEQVFTGFPGKEFNEYRVRDGKWERRNKGATSWQTVINEGSILGLNKQFKQNVEVTKDIEKAKIDQKREIDNKKNLNKLLSSVNSNLVGSSEEYASEELEKKFPGFKFIQQGLFSDNLLVIAPNDNRANISLDNFTDSDDRSQATVLREFIRNNSDEEMAAAERELSFAEREKERFLERSEKEMFENDIPSEFKFVNGKLVISTYVDKQTKTKQYGAIEDKLKENRKKYIDKKEEQFDDIYYRFKNQPYEPNKMEAAYASVRKDDAEIKRVNDYINDVRNTSKDIASEKSKIEEQMNDLVVKLRSGEITREQYNAEYKPAIEEKLLDLKNRGNQLANEIGNINVVNKAVDESIAKNFIIDESKGSFGGGMASKFVKGLTYIPRIAAAGSMSKKEQNDLVDLITGKGTTQEYTESSDRSDLVKSLFSLSESMGALTAGAALGGGAATYASFYAQSYYEMKDELDEIKGMTDAEKVLMSSVYGSLSSVLEKFGVDMITQKTPIGRNLKNNILKRMFSDLPKGASKEFIDAAMLNSVKMTLANAGLNAAGGAVGEGVTESLQSLSSVGIKEVYDRFNGNKYFNNKSGWEILSDVMYEGYLGALGGGVMSTVASSASVVKNGLLNAVNKEQAELLVNAAKTEGVDQALITNLKASILKGNITKEEAKVIADSFNEIKGKIQSMPDNLSISDKSVALDLMVEKDKIEQEIAGKDENLVAAQKARIADINNQLKTISENATKKSTEQQQEGAAEGGVIQREGTSERQPEVGQGEGTVGQATQQGTDLGNRPVEGRGETQVTARQAINRPAMLTAFGGTTFDSPLQGDTYVEGQQVIFEDRSTGRVYELGNVDEVMDSTIPGLQLQEETISVTQEGKVSIDGNNWNIQSELPTQGVEYNPDGTVMRVSLKDDNGNTQMFDGQQAVDIAYQIELQKMQTPEQQQFINDLLEQDEEFQAATESIKPTEVEAVIEEETAPDTVQTEPTTEPTAEPTAPQSEVEALGKLLEGTDVEIDQQIDEVNVPADKNRVLKSVAKAAKSISKILPNVKFIVHETDDSYRKATGEEGRSQSSRGTYMPATQAGPATIHINLTNANNRTVAHEVFHAILLDRVSSDKQAAAVTRRMISAISKNLANNSDLKKYLDNFAANYDQNIQNEEKLAELVGILAENYMNQSPTIKDIIKRWLNKIAQFIGRRPITSETEVMDLLDTIARRVTTGKKIRERKVAKIIGEKDQPSIASMNKRFQVDFKDPKTGVEFVFDKNSDKFKKLEDDGYITRDKSIKDFNGSIMFLHQPDGAFSGMIYKNGELLVEGKGGVFYPIKFHEDGYFWASTDSAATKMAKDLNKVYEENGGKIFMALTTAPEEKLLSSTTAANAVMEIFMSKAFDRGFSISRDDVKKSLLDAASYSEIKKTLVTDADGNSILDSKGQKQYKNKRVGLSLNLKKGGTIDDIKSDIATKLNPSESSFADRKLFAQRLISNIANIVKQNPKATEQFNLFFKESIKNEQFKGTREKGKDYLKISSANLKQAISNMLTEPMLKGNKNAGEVYAILEIGSKVKPVESDKHESYPKAIQVDGDSKTTLHILTDRILWSNIFEDFKTGKIVTSKREKKIYPTSGVSVRGLRLNTSNIEEGVTQRKQLPDLLDRKQQQSASSIVSVARKNGFSEAAIKQYLESKGFSANEITSAMAVNDTIDIDEIFERSKKALREKKSKNTFMKALRFVWNKFIDRQSDIKRLINGIKTAPSAKAFNLLVTRAGAKGFANYRYKEAEDKIYKGLKEKDIDTLDKMIYLRRIIAINENRAERGMEAYRGIEGFSEAEAKRDLEQMKEDLGTEKYNDMMKRADEYFKVFAQSLKNLYESGRLTEEVYNNLKDIEYSPIATIKYIIGDDLSLDEIDRQAEIYGITRKDIATLTDKNENEIIMDSRWLLMMNLMSIEARAWENRMLNSFADAIESADENQKKALSEFVVIPKSDQKVPAGFVTVNYFKDGKAKKMFVKADYAVQLLDIKTRQSGLEAIGKLSFTQVLRFFATAANPVFIIGNTAVDFKNIAFFSDTYSKNKFIAVPRLAYDFLKNFLRKTKNTKRYNEVKKEFMEHGGGMDFMSSDGLRVLKNLRPGYKVTSTAQSIMVKYANAMSYLGETSELAFRIAVYEKTKENLIKKYKKENEGKEPKGEDLDNIMFESAREARQTVDFSQGGNWAKSIDIVMPYMNASLQGFRRPLEYAKKSPIGFASSMVQASLMSGSVAAMSLAALMSSFGDDDEEDEKKAKAIDALNSISEYEKGNYHIVFTGKKNKDGEYEYKRIKKLPVLSMVSTLTEQMVYKYLLSNDKRPYAFDSKAMKQAAEKSIPFSLSDIFSRNPLASAFITYYFNEDTFTGEEIFRQPRDKKIDPTAEGIYDDKVEEFYKQIAPALGLSPIRSKAFIEKIVTSENTNPTIAIFNAALNGIFDKKTGLGEEFSGAIDRVFESAGKKITRYTNKDIIMYNEMDKAEAEEMRIETDIYKKEQKVYSEIKSIYKDGGKMTVGQLGDMVKENFEKQDWERYVEKYYTYIQNMNVDRSVLDILYEKTPEVQALKFYNRYGSTLDDEEIQEISSTIRTANKKISDKTFLIYKRKYQRGN